MKTKKRVHNYSRTQGGHILIKIPPMNKTLTFYKKTKVASISRRIKEKEWLSGVGLEVVYQKGVTNSYTFHSKAEFTKALNTWTEKDLVNFCTSGEW